MAITGGMSCVKYLLFCFNLLFAITGLIILIAGTVAEIHSSPYIDLTDEKFYTSAPVVLIIVGIIVFVVAFFGCCGAVKENHCMIVTTRRSIQNARNDLFDQPSSSPLVQADVIEDFLTLPETEPYEDSTGDKNVPTPEKYTEGNTLSSVLVHAHRSIDTDVIVQTQPDSSGRRISQEKFSVFLLIIFVAELSVGIAGYMRHQELETSLMKHLNESITKYNTDKNVQNTFDIMQTDLTCCGVNGASDWAANGMPIPDSCCAGQVISDGVAAACTLNSDSLHTKGCYPTLLAYLKNIAYMLGGVGMGIAFVQLLGVIFACCLARSIRSQYETV